MRGLKTIVAEGNSIIEALRNMVSKQEIHLKEKDQWIVQIREDNARLKNHNDKMVKDCHNYQLEITGMTDLLSENNKQLVRLEDKLKEVYTKFGSLKKDKSELESVNERIQENVGQYRLEIIRVHEESRVVRDANKELTKEIAELKKKTQDLSVMETRNNFYESLVGQLREEIDRLKHLETKVSFLNDTIMNLEAKIVDFSSSEGYLSKENARLLSVISETQKSFAESEVYKEKLASMNDTLHKLVKRNAVLSESSIEADKKIVQLKDDNHRYSVTVQSLKEELEEYDRENEMLSDGIKERDATIERMRSQPNISKGIVKINDNYVEFLKSENSRLLKEGNVSVNYFMAGLSATVAAAIVYLIITQAI